MSKTVIQVNNLSKRYRIGLKEKRHDTFVGQLGAVLKAPIDNFRRLRSMSKFGAEDESVFWALKDINFEVKEGEVLGIIGHNGAGKSTLLKILSRITEPTSGQIKIKGRIAALLEVGTGFHPDLTGRENVYMNGTILGMTKREIDAKFDEIVDFSGVEKYIDTPVKFYSSGMKVRLGFAVAAHLEPEILIIDEVLAVGDAEFQRKCLGKMHDVAENEGRTVLFVSHNMAAIEGLCNRCILLNRGSIVVNDDTEKTIHQYRRSTLENSEGDLGKKKDRQGNGDFKFTKVTFNKGEPVIPGKELQIEMCYESKKTLKSLQIALTFCKNFDERVLVIDNKTQGIKIEITPGIGSICIALPKLYLLPNSYIVNLWAAEGNIVTDYVLNGGRLDVESADVFGTGSMLNAQKHGVFFSDKCKWSFS